MAHPLVGLLPAAGRGTRLGSIPCSKEIMPLGFRLQHTATTPTGAGVRQPVTALESHLHALREAGVTRTALIIGESKYDIVRYIGDGSQYGQSVAYFYQQQLRGMPFALDLATAWIGAATTLFAMPDTLITPSDTLQRVLHYHTAHPADVTLGLFSTRTPHKFGMVERAADGLITAFVDKPAQTDLRYMWGLAVWEPTFTTLLHSTLHTVPPGGKECVLSDIFAAARAAGLRVQGVVLDPARYRDIGTPEDFQAVVYELAGEQANRIATASGSPE